MTGRLKSARTPERFCCVECIESLKKHRLLKRQGSLLTEPSSEDALPDQGLENCALLDAKQRAKNRQDYGLPDVKRRATIMGDSVCFAF